MEGSINIKPKENFINESPRLGMQRAAARVRERLLVEQTLPGFRRRRGKRTQAHKTVKHSAPWDSRFSHTSKPRDSHIKLNMASTRGREKKRYGNLSTISCLVFILSFFAPRYESDCSSGQVKTDFVHQSRACSPIKLHCVEQALQSFELSCSSPVVLDQNEICRDFLTEECIVSLLCYQNKKKDLAASGLWKYVTPAKLKM